MNFSRNFLISFGALSMAFAANAGATMNTPAMAPITNGGTGYIGLTDSAGQPRTSQSRPWMASTQTTMRVPGSAGEASTMVNGRPNANPDAPGADSMGSASPDLRTMGNSGGAMTGPSHNPAWGTPD